MRNSFSFHKLTENRAVRAALLTLTVSLGGSFASSVSAGVLTFDSLVVNQWFHIAGTSTAAGWTISHDGFLISNTTTQALKGITANGISTCGPPCPDNGTNYLLAHGAGFNFALESGDVFSMANMSFLGAESHQGIPSLWAPEIVVTGQISGGGTISQSFALDFIHDGVGGVADFQSFTISSAFTNLESISFEASNGTGHFSIDSLNYETIPEPATLALMGLGLAGIGYKRHRSKISA